MAKEFWPLSNPSTKFTFPKALDGASEKFKYYYSQVHSGRKLLWLHNLSKGELKIRIDGRMYMLLVSTYQIGVLMLFNEKEQLSYEEFLDKTQLSEEFLTSILAVLEGKKIIISSQKEIGSGAVFRVNDKFKSKKAKVQLNVALEVDTRKETTTTLKQIEEERKVVIQACIVRIMKARKKLKHSELISEVFTQLQERFKPKVKTVRSCIDLLIDKEYLERAEGTTDTYNYLA